jgi:hypothetical protein
MGMSQSKHPVNLGSTSWLESKGGSLRGLKFNKVMSSKHAFRDINLVDLVLSMQH